MQKRSPATLLRKKLRELKSSNHATDQKIYQDHLISKTARIKDRSKTLSKPEPSVLITSDQSQKARDEGMVTLKRSLASNPLPGWQVFVNTTMSGGYFFSLKCLVHPKRKALQVSKYQFLNRNFDCKQCCWEKHQLKKQETYYWAVLRETVKSWRAHYHSINPHGYRRGKDYHLDHIYSIHQGFIDGVDPKIIGSHVNLQMLDAPSNIRKGKACHMTLDELKNRYLSLSAPKRV